MRRLLRLLRSLLVIAALVVVLVVGGVLALEAGGGLERVLQGELDRLVAAEPDLELTFRRAEIDWLAPSLSVEGLHLFGSEGELYLESVDLYLDLSEDAKSPLHGIEVGRGRLVIEQAFTEAALRSMARFQQRMGQDVEAGPLVPDADMTLPTIGLDGLDVALRQPDGTLVELGQGEARFELVEQVLSVRGTVDVAQGQGGPRPLFVEATQTPDGRSQLRAATRNLDLASRGSVLRRFLPPALRSLDFSARASVDMEAVLVDGLLTESTSHLRLERGYLRAGDELPALEDLELVSDLSWTRPAEGVEAWRGAQGRGRFTAGILGETLTGETRLGGDGRLLVDVADRELALGEDLLEAAGLPPGHPTREACHALGLEGRVDVDLGIALDLERDLTRPGALAEALDLAAEVRSNGGASFCYNGYEVSGLRQGFPLRADRVQAQIAMGFSGKNRRAALVGLLDLEALHGTGPMRARGMIATPLVARSEPDLDLVIDMEDRALDETLRAALAGMPGTDTIWDELRPRGGSVSALLRLRSREHEGGIVSQLELTARDAPMRWAGLPVDLYVDELELWLRWSEAVALNERNVPVRAAGAVWRARGRSNSVEDLEVVGMSRDRVPLRRLADPTATPLHVVEVTGSGLALRGADWDGLVQVAPDLAEVTDELGAKGRIDFRWTDRAVSRGGTREVDLDATPAELQLLPKAFPMVLRDVEGRINLSDHGDGEGSLHAVLDAAWAAGPVLAAQAAVSIASEGLGGTAEPGTGAAGDRVVTLAAPGLDPSNQALLGALASIPDDPGRAQSAGLEDSPELEGRVDLTGVLTAMPSEDGEAPELRSDLTLVLRDNLFRSGPLELADLEGRLTLTEGSLTSPRVTGSLAGTPVELSEPTFTLAPDADGTFFRTRLTAEDLPLDREHLSAFLEPDTLGALTRDLGWRGEVDLDGIGLELARPDEGSLRVTLAGNLVPSAMELVLGFPIKVARAEVELEELVLESGRARAWGRTRGLFGAVAGRELRDAALLFSYVDQRLTIEALEAAFAGGRMTSSGGGQGLALALDLVPPHHFTARVDLRGVQAGELLSGAFDGGANRGTIDASVRLEGLPGDLLAASGGGWLRIEDARLFSIPVFRELFTQLGFDATAVFDTMRTTFALQDGVVELRELRARSPLLHLVGDGFWDLDGSIFADLEVRYSVIDKLGPLRFFVYWFQNSILRVAVRGDMYRPVVLLRNSLLDLFGEKPVPQPRLPLPPSSKPRP